MQTLQQQKQTQLISLNSKDLSSHFPDQKTRQLYSALSCVEGQNCNEAQMREAEALTSLNSHFSMSKYKSFQQAKTESYAFKGQTLRQNSNPADFNRNRNYSIVKVSKERKRAITVSEFERAPKDKGKPREIVYAYAQTHNQRLPSEREVVQSRYVTGEKEDSLKSSRYDLRSLLSTHYNPNSSQSNPRKQAILYREKAKSYKFVKMEKKSQGPKQEKLTCNLFNFLDHIVDKQEPTLQKYPSKKMEIIAKPIKLKLWSG